MDCTIEYSYPAKALLEVSVNIDGRVYHVILGTHVGGGFLCIPNWGIVCDRVHPDNVSGTAEALTQCRLSKTVAKAIAETVQHAAALLLPNDLAAEGS